MALHFHHLTDKLIYEPKSSVILIGLIPTIHVLKNNFISDVLILILSFCVCAFSIIRYTKNKRKNFLTKFIHLSEEVSTIMFCCSYIFLYDLVTPINTINILFLIISIILLSPFILEIAFSTSKGS